MVASFVSNLHARSRYGGPFDIWDWPGDALGWLDRHSGAMTVLVSAAAGVVAVALVWTTWKTLRTTREAFELERRNAELEREKARRATEPIIRGSLGPVTDTDVCVLIRNVGLGPAVDIALSPRELEGVGVPVKGDYVAGLMPGEGATFVLARFSPANTEARAEFDLVYSDARQSVVKRQLWTFHLAHDVVTMQEFSHVVFEVKGRELTTPREGLIDAEGMVRVPAHPVQGPHPERQYDEPDFGFLSEAETLSDAWLMKHGSYLTGSTRYLHLLRAIEERKSKQDRGAGNVGDVQ